MRGANIGSDHTLRDNLRHLILVGLIDRKVNSGAQEGNEYFVFLPEEVNLPFDREGNPLQLLNPPQISSPRHLGQKLPGAPGAETAGGAGGLSAEGSTTSGEPKTSFKTKDEKTDDEALALFTTAMGKATRELTGKSLSLSEAQRWAELADVLVTELKIAAGRTTVSSVPAFLAEHLRRRLFKKDQKQLASEAMTAAPTTPTAQKVDASQCPDCFGTGMHYPEGYDKGVARCRHEKLTDPAAAIASATSTAPPAPSPTDGDLVEMAVGFLHQGMDIEAVGQLLSASLDAEQWPRIRAAALERHERERGQMHPPGKP